MSTDDRRLTPVQLEVLLHYSYCPQPHPRINSPATVEAIGLLEHYGCLVFGEKQRAGIVYKLTAKGREVVRLACSHHPRKLVQHTTFVESDDPEDWDE